MGVGMEWPGGERSEPDEVLLDFLAKLPSTIRDSVLAGCLIAFDLVRLDPDRDALTDLREALKEGSATGRPYQCAMLMGAVELCLEQLKGDAEYYQELWAEHGIESFRDMALRAPLRDRHYEGSREAFRKLREDALSPRTLRIWQSFLIARDDLEQIDS
jgi:hypothetical protein